MKNIIALSIALLCINFVYAQSPVKWDYSAKKIGDLTYEVKFTAKVDAPWHIYSQTTPEGGPLPTSFSFAKNPLVTFTGTVNEAGKLMQKFEEVFEVNVKYFDGDVVFTQKVKLKSKAKTAISGTIEYMACTDEECLPPTVEKFSVKIE